MKEFLKFKILKGALECELTPIQCYMALQEVYGTSDCYIFESLEGPSHAVNSAFVGFGKILSISVKDGYVQFEGQHSIVSFIIDRLLKLESIIVDEGDIFIRKGKVFEVLSFLHGLLAYSERTNIGFLSTFSYDSIKYIEEQLGDSSELNYKIPDINLTLYKSVIEFDLKNHSIQYEEFCSDGIERVDWNNIKPLFERYIRYGILEPKILETLNISDSMEEKEFIDIAKNCLEHIADGDIYQIQIGHEISISTDTKPFDVYLQLRKINPSPYMYFVPINVDTYAIGASPELFVKKENLAIHMRPIAGTTKKTGRKAEDLERIEELIHNEKELAEHLMLIDLCRNDLAKICSTGSLHVVKQFFVEEYSHVFHLVSAIEALMEPKYNIFDVIKAGFPAGTMTGTPKIEAMKLINKYESTGRGLYAGTIGHITLNGDAILALCIRTAIYYSGAYHIRASAGIVSDSRPDNEWRETLNKMAATYYTITGENLVANRGE